MWEMGVKLNFEKPTKRLKFDALWVLGKVLAYGHVFPEVCWCFQSHLGDQNWAGVKKVIFALKSLNYIKQLGLKDTL